MDMKRVLIAAALALTGCSPSTGTMQGAAPTPAETGATLAESASAEGPPPSANGAPPGAEAVIKAWATQQYGANLLGDPTIFYGDFNGDGAADALAWADYATGGTSANHGVALFRNDSGRMTFVRTVDDVYGMEPRDAHFSNGRITLTTSTVGPNDPLCCPTQPHQWTIRTN